MAGIRTFNTNLPHVFRFPEWTEGVFYPKASVVAVETPSNGVLYNEYYIAIKDVTAKSTLPEFNTDEWALLFGDNGIDSDIQVLLRDSDFIQTILNLDSEMGVLRRDLDSDRHDWQAADSDLRLDMDSERHDWKAADSDLRTDMDSERHDWKASDSDLGRRIDSDRHDFIARDSELKYYVDSELRIVRSDADSDRLEGFDRDSDLRAEFDSEFRVVRVDMDSEYRARLDGDSDLAAALDSERHDWKAGDSELRYYFDSEMAVLRKDIDSDIHYSKSVDSELYLRLDSELHDRKADDSEIYVKIDSEVHALENADSDIRHRLRELDSDLATLFERTDSDNRTLQAIRTQLVESIDSEIRIRLEADSDLDLLIRETIHNYLANDSEIDSDFLAVKRRIDSEFDAAVRIYTHGPDSYPWGPQPFITSTRYYLKEEELTNHINGWLWLTDNDRNNIYIIKNGKTIVTYDTQGGSALTLDVLFDSDNVEWRRGDLIEESPGDDADVSIWRDKDALIPLTTSANIYTIQQRYENKAFHTEQVDLDTAFRRTVTTVVQIDSDVNFLMTEFDRLDRNYDSEIANLANTVGDLEERIDSDLAVFNGVVSGADSDTRAWKSADSDIRATIKKITDSDIDTMKQDIVILYEQNDSEYLARRDEDSDLRNGYHGVSYRYVKYVQKYFTTTTGLWYIDFDGTTGNVLDLSGHVNGWVWNPVNDRLVVSDSDGNVIYNKVHEAEPILVELDSDTRIRRGTDSGVDVDIRINFSSSGVEDAYNYRFEHISHHERQEDYVLETFIDSDKDIKDADSENKDALKWIGNWMRERDSDIKMEIHDRKAGDSDIIEEFRIPEETIELVTGTSDYPLINPLLNENTRWSYRTEIHASSSIYTGVVNDHFEINHDGTKWTISVDGVQGREYVDIFISGSAIVSGQKIDLFWDDNSIVSISPLSSDNVRSIALQLYNAFLDKNVTARVDVNLGSTTYSADGRIAPSGTFTHNGIDFTFIQNVVTDEGFYYKDADTITIRKK